MKNHNFGSEDDGNDSGSPERRFDCYAPQTFIDYCGLLARGELPGIAAYKGSELSLIKNSTKWLCAVQNEALAKCGINHLNVYKLTESDPGNEAVIIGWDNYPWKPHFYQDAEGNLLPLFSTTDNIAIGNDGAINVSMMLDVLSGYPEYFSGKPSREAELVSREIGRVQSGELVPPIAAGREHAAREICERSKATALEFAVTALHSATQPYGIQTYSEYLMSLGQEEPAD